MVSEIRKFRKVKAYTLVELLVVMGVLLIAFSVIYVGSNSGDGTKLSSAQRTLSGLVKTARSQAILKNARVRLIIHNDANINEIDKYRRFIGIVYYGTDSSDNTGWIAADKGTYLPKGIYFDPATSSTLSGTIWTIASAMQINYPRLSAQTEDSGTNFLFYEFNSNGTSSNSNAYLIFRAGKVVPGTDNTVTLDLPSSDQQQKSRIRSGLIIRKAGTATLINDPDDIDIN